jgi:hypothetical protein
MAQEPKADNVARQQCDDQRRAVMHEWPVSLTDDRFKEWRHMLGSADFRSPRIKFLFLKPNMPTGIWETAWRSAGADVGITIDSILIVESNRALGLAPWGRCRGAHGALFKQGKF